MDSNQDDPKILLEGLRQHHVVRVHNPLDTPFTWPVARSVVHLQDRHRDPYVDKLNMRNDSHPTMSHVTQQITIEAGATYNLPGDVAKVYVKHLVDEVIARAGKRVNSGDPTLRRSYEEKVIVNKHDLVSRLSTQSIEQQLEQQITDLNKQDVNTEAESNAAPEPTAFPGLQSAQPDGAVAKPAGADKQPAAAKATAGK